MLSIIYVNNDNPVNWKENLRLTLIAGKTLLVNILKLNKDGQRST